jgi:hypothetical protein
MVSPGDLHDYRLTAAAPGAWLVSATRSRCRRGRAPTWSATAAGEAAAAGGDPGLEPGRGRRHRHAACDLLSSRCAATRVLQARSIATGTPCRTQAAAAPPSLPRREVPCGVEPAKVAAGSALRVPPRSPPAAPPMDGRRGSGTPPARCPPGPTAGPGRARGKAPPHPAASSGRNWGTTPCPPWS